MSISLLLFVLVTVTTGGRGQQGTHCQVFPSNYTFTTSHISNAGNGILEVTNCTNNLPYTTCPHPSALTDSNTGGDTFHIAQYLQWSESNQFSQLLFTFSTEVDLELVRLYYYFDPEKSIARFTLEFLAVPDDFTLGTTTPPHSTPLYNATLPRREGTSSIVTSLLSVTTRQLLVNKRSSRFINFGISEVEFYTQSEDSDCGKFNISINLITVSPAASTDMTHTTRLDPTTITSSTTPSEVTDPLNTSHTDIQPSKTTAMDNEIYSPSTSTTNNDSSSTTTNNSSPAPPPSSPGPVVYIAAGVVVIVILVTVVLIVIVIVIVTCRKKQSSVKDSKENVSYSKSHDLKLSPHTGQVESQTRSPQTTTNTTAEIYADPDDGLAVYAVVNKQKKKKKKDKNKPSVPEPYQQATPTESHDTTPNDTYAVVDMSKKKRKKKMASHLDEEGAPPPPVPEHTIDQLYAVVQKKPKKKKKKEELPTDEDDDTPPPVPPAIMEDI